MPTCFPFPWSLLALLDDEPKLILRVCGTVGNSSEVLMRILPGHGQTSFNNVGTRERDRSGGRSRLGAWGGERAPDSEGRSHRVRGSPAARGPTKGDPARRALREPSPRESPAASSAGTSPSAPVHRVRQPFIFSLRLVTEESPGAQRRSSLVSVSPRRK